MRIVQGIQTRVWCLGSSQGLREGKEESKAKRIGLGKRVTGHWERILLLQEWGPGGRHEGRWVSQQGAASRLVQWVRWVGRNGSTRCAKKLQCVFVGQGGV